MEEYVDIKSKTIETIIANPNNIYACSIISPHFNNIIDVVNIDKKAIAKKRIEITFIDLVTMGVRIPIPNIKLAILNRDFEILCFCSLFNLYILKIYYSKI